MQGIDGASYIAGPWHPQGEVGEFLGLLQSQETAATARSRRHSRTQSGPLPQYGIRGLGVVD